THLGMIEQMELNCTGAVGSLEELQVLDWCSSVVQSECLSVHSDSSGTDIRLQYWRKQRDGAPVTVHLRWKQNETTEAASLFPIIDCQIRCLRGQVHLTSESALSWEQSEPIGETSPQTESLQSDRTAEELMYNLFGRRLVGGLVPVPDISDLIRAHAIRAARDLSRQNQKDIPPIFSEKT
ncbi:MAG TPA: hypothetical protein VNQ76_06250, partial [Planctomicrobium sp.]|nr:hypothetical protein [Planctomicrobium sp.]